MRLILLEDIERLGASGDIVTVKEGYGRNYLIPKNKATFATPGNMKIFESIRAKKAGMEKDILEKVKALADKVSNLSLTLSEQAGEEDKLYGSVTSEMIASALELEGISIDKKDVIIEEPIKKLGVYQVGIKLHPEVKANLRVWVVKKQG